MTQIVPVQPGFSEVVASGPQYGVKYVLTGMQGDGVRATFNDPSDADHVGYLTNISGLDSPDVREAADDLIGDDGGVHGNFYYSRRPIVLEGMIDNRPHGIHSEIVEALLASPMNGVLNPSAEVDTTNWSSFTTSGTATLSRVTSNSRSGSAAFQVDNSGGTGTPTVEMFGTDQTTNYPVTPGQTIWALGSLLNVSANSALALTIRFQNSSGALLSQTTVATQNSPTVSTWYDLAGSMTVPASAAFASIRAVGTATGGASTFLGDSFYLEQTATQPTYFDGSTGAPAGLRYGWAGTAHASFSRAYSQTQVPFAAPRVRNIRMTALQRVTNAMRKDMQMRWTPEGGTEQVLYLRRQQPLRISGGFNKSFQVSLVAADPRIYAAAINEARINPGTPLTVRNNGSIRTQPVATIYGPTSGTMNTIVLQNQTTGESMIFAPAYALGVGQYIVLDFANKTVTRENGTNIYDQIQFATSAWWQVEPGDNPISFTAAGTTTGANVALRWQDAWV